MGGWSYEVVDTKLAQETRAGTVLQLCLYSDLVAPDAGPGSLTCMHVVKPAAGFAKESFRFNDYSAYYRLVRRRLEEVVDPPPSSTTYPYPVAHCDICRWWKECDARRHADDHLCLVAGIRPLHVASSSSRRSTPSQQFAQEPAPFRKRPARGSEEAFARAHGQARIQLAGRKAGRVLHELLPLEPDGDFPCCPAPDPGDIYFDIESDPFAGEAGLEYLLGVASVGKGGLGYTSFWALDAATREKRAPGVHGPCHGAVAEASPRCTSTTSPRTSRAR